MAETRLPVCVVEHPRSVRCCVKQTKNQFHLVISRELDGQILRALVRKWPGGAPDLIVQRITLGDEAKPEKVAEEVRVDHTALNTIDSAMWSEDGLSFTEAHRRWFVRVTADKIAAKAIRD